MAQAAAQLRFPFTWLKGSAPVRPNRGVKTGTFWVARLRLILFSLAGVTVIIGISLALVAGYQALINSHVFSLKKLTVIGQDRRYTFRNPQPALYDRIAAVRQIVRQVPVNGRVLFLDGAEFTKGVPSLVCDLDQLVRDFGEPDKDAARFKIEAFKPHWEIIVNRAG